MASRKSTNFKVLSNQDDTPRKYDSNKPKVYIEQPLTFKLTHIKNNDPLLLKLNPTIRHMFQTGTNTITISHLEETAEQSVEPLSRCIVDSSPRMPYKRRTDEFKKQLHWGQLKLMLTEVEFLNLTIQKSKESKNTLPITIVYAGAAPGDHIAYLHTLFPMVYFELYDPNPFTVKASSHINIHQQFFTTKDAHYWRDYRGAYVVFCSDIRTEPANEENVAIDMERQKQWYLDMNPEFTMFKFRLPWSAGITEYPSGEIYIQPYPGPTSTETRLLIKKDAPMKKYDHIVYEEQLFFHNFVTRTKSFGSKHLNLLDSSIDNCYDCSVFNSIMKQYCELFNKSLDLVPELIIELQNKITGQHTIYSQTMRQNNQTLQNIFDICCGKERGKIGFSKWKSVSKATKKATDDAEANL